MRGVRGDVGVRGGVEGEVVRGLGEGGMGPRR